MVQENSACHCHCQILELRTQEFLPMTPFKVAAPLAGNTLGSIDSSFVVAECRDAGGSSESPRLIAPWHVHHKDDEAWYVLEGELRVRMGAEEVAVKAGARAFFSPGTGHTNLNSAREAAPGFLVISAK